MNNNKLIHIILVYKAIKKNQMTIIVKLTFNRKKQKNKKQITQSTKSKFESQHNEGYYFLQDYWHSFDSIAPAAHDFASHYPQ